MTLKLFLIIGSIFLGSIFFSIVPSISSGYIVAFLIYMFMYVNLGYSWNIISGYTGYLSFGHIAFFGLGGYTVAILTTKCGVNFYMALLLSGLLSIIVGLFLGTFMLRLSGVFFAFGMLGLSQIFRVIASAWRSMTNGGTGIFLAPTMNVLPVYFIYLAIALGLLVFTWWLENSKFGLRLMSIREDEQAACSLGINTNFYKTVAFALSAGLVGVVGGVQTWYLSYIDPEVAFSLYLNVSMIIMCVFGGAGTVLGPLVGTMSLGIISEIFWAKFPELYLIIYGGILVLVVMYMPKGVIEFITTEIKRLREGPISAFDEATEAIDLVRDE